MTTRASYPFMFRPIRSQPHQPQRDQPQRVSVRFRTPDDAVEPWADALRLMGLTADRYELERINVSCYSPAELETTIDS